MNETADLQRRSRNVPRSDCNERLGKMLESSSLTGTVLLQIYRRPEVDSADTMHCVFVSKIHDEASFTMRRLFHVAEDSACTTLAAILGADGQRFVAAERAAA